ncbi:MAG: hypothetical protein SH817_00060 [Leptospira sp.]|nr:hypothetical protein [Leptospira sp.]
MRILIFFSLLLSNCNGNKFNPLAYLTPLESISETTFELNYGENQSSDIFSDKRFIIENNSQICILSLPKSFYDAELGVKFKICLPSNEDLNREIHSGFVKLDSGENSNTKFYLKGPNWEIRDLTYNEWFKETKDLIPLVSWSENKTNENVISYSKFDVPSAHFYEWTPNECEVLYPSLAIGNTKKSWRILSLNFKCPKNISFGEKITEINQKWLTECVPGQVSLSESFRHSESPFGKFIEWENNSEQILCPTYDTLGFFDQSKNVHTFISDSSLKEIERFHKIVLPKSTFILTTSEQLTGNRIEDEFLAQIGKKGKWIWNQKSFEETPYSFKQADEFFSLHDSSVSCHFQRKIQNQNESCMSPGIPNDFGTLFLPIETQNLPCHPDQILFTEYFAGVSNTISWPMFIEFKNRGDKCDLSNLTLVYEEENFPLSSKPLIIESNDIFIISRERWDGWQFLGIQKPLPTKIFLYQLPKLSLTDSRDVLVSYSQSKDNFIITNDLNTVNRSIIRSGNGILLPHPNLLGNENYSHQLLHITPGFISNAEINFLNPKFSEILLNGTRDSLGSYAERFIEWESPLDSSGYISFSILNELEKKFIFYKPQGEIFSVLKSGEGPCLRDKGKNLPEGALLNENTSIHLLRFDGSVVNGSNYEFDYDSSIYLNHDLVSTTRFSINKEVYPFQNSISKPGSFLNSCSPLSEASPGFANRRENQVVPIKTIRNSNGIFNIEYEFLFPPSSSSKYEITNLIHLQDSGLNVIIQDNRSILNFENFIYNPAFLDKELLYLRFFNADSNKALDVIHRLGEVQIEGVYPGPENSQNEWVYFCNKREYPISLEGYTIEDETSSDQIVSYISRFPNAPPIFKNGNSIIYNSNVLNAGACAFLVDPDGAEWYLPPFAKNNDLLLTISSSQTIGNGISLSEKLNIHKEENSYKYLISTYGKLGSASSFNIPLKAKEYTLLKPNYFGNQREDYSIYRELE